jgi:ABC-type dipeptide/oligopeptide/nickel transport system ATPase subunit
MRNEAAMESTTLETRNLNFSYHSGAPILNDINISIRKGQNVGLVGESGSGKSTLLRLLLGIHRPTAGHILFEGEELALGNKAQARKFRSKVQVVFQDPYSSLDPRQRVDQLIAEPLRSLGMAKEATSGQSRAALRGWIDNEVQEALRSVGLPANSARRYPDEFSGGQRQRIAIARAIVCKPEVLLADEPVSALDVSTRVHVIDLLAQLGQSRGLTIVMVSHDLAVVAALCQQTIVLEKGVVVEQGLTSDVLGAPSQTYTRKLIDSLPRLPVN